MESIPYKVVEERLADLNLGFHGAHADFDWRPYSERSPEARADYDRLIVSIFHHGIRRPLITCEKSVLIGMRRAEIGRRLGIERVVCWRIMENAGEWTGADIARLNELKKLCGAVEY